MFAFQIGVEIPTPRASLVYNMGCVSWQRSMRKLDTDDFFLPIIFPEKILMIFS